MVDCQEEQAKYSSHKNEKIKSHTLFCKLLAVKHAKMSSIGAAERKFRVKKEKRIKRMDTKWIRGNRIREWIQNESKIKNKVSSKNRRSFAKKLDGGGNEQLLEKFMSRNGLSLRRRTTQAQKTPEQIIDEVISYVLYVR